jgi:hypothetical protein
MTPKRLRQIVYISAALKPADEAMLRDIFGVSYRNNERRGITGLLLHVEGSFMQALEGDHHILDELMQRIARDRRHKSLSILTDEPITQRSFGAWGMSLGDVTSQEVALLPGMSDFLRQPPKIARHGQSPAILLLETFKKTNARLIRPG